MLYTFLTVLTGTKVHQVTRKAIAKRKPALISAINKYNKYCDKLKSLHSLNCPFPIPKHLPLELADLWDNSDLMEDV